ncbi:cytochrome P450 [Actinocatenispora comari]|uniref:Cytochrome P450 n=1 Tax=Actinocatenispora comari TaxID=2807577 RepID=A0A8J4EJD0_9ACTN|nr:cytochrome P450 [Actinocatenispora comari]
MAVDRHAKGEGVAVATTRALPGPRGSALAGNERAYQHDRIGFLQRCQQQYGDVFRLDAGTVVVCDPDRARRILADSQQRFRAEGMLLSGARPGGRAPLADWPAARDAAARELTTPMLAAHAGRLVETFPHALATLAERTLPGVSALQRLSAIAVADFCLGRPGWPDAELSGAIAESALALVAVLDSGLQLPRWIPDPRRRRLRAADRALSAALTRAVTERLDQPPPESPGDLLDQVRAEDAGRTATSRALLTTLAGMHAVPGTALCWLVATLAEHPETCRRIRCEAADGLAEVAETAQPDRLAYTAATVREVLRLYPPTWLVSRQVAEPVEVAGWRLEPGEQVLISPYLMHRDPRRWDEPDRFCPERFLALGAHGHAYLPFGAGPGSRLSARLGMLQLTLLTALIARDYTPAVRPLPVAPRFATLLIPTELRFRLLPPEPEESTVDN